MLWWLTRPLGGLALQFAMTLDFQSYLDR